MPFAFTFSLLLLGSGLMTFSLPAKLTAYREHFGLILLVYGFGNFLGYIREFIRLLEEHPGFAATKMSMWIMIMVIGFVLAFPLLERHVFEKTRELGDQGRQVFEGFEGMRIPLGIMGIGIAGIMLMAQIGLI